MLIPEKIDEFRIRLATLNPLTIVIATVAIAGAGYVCAIFPLKGGIQSRDRLSAYIQRSPLTASAAWGAHADSSKRSVILGRADGDGYLVIPLPPLRRTSASDLYVTGAAPKLYARDSSISVSVNGQTIAMIKARGRGYANAAPFDPDIAPTSSIPVPPNPEDGYRFPISAPLCRTSCAVTIRAVRAEWQIDRVGFAHFDANSEPPAFDEYDDR